MSTMQGIKPDLVIVDEKKEEPEIIHLVCHCTDGKIAACRKDVSDEPYGEPEDVSRLILCPLCVLCWPQYSKTCPWGCSCTKSSMPCATTERPNLPVAPV